MEILQFLNFLDPSTKAFLNFCGISVLVSFEGCISPYIFLNITTNIHVVYVHSKKTDL